MKKRIDSVELSPPRKRGGQPGNRNALKTGRQTAKAKVERRRLGDVLRRARFAIRNAELIIADRRRDPAQRKSAR